MADKILDIKQVREMLHLSERTVFRLMQAGTLKGGFKVGREWRFLESDITNFIQAQKEKAAQPVEDTHAA